MLSTFCGITFHFSSFYFILFSFEFTTPFSSCFRFLLSWCFLIFALNNNINKYHNFNIFLIMSGVKYLSLSITARINFISFFVEGKLTKLLEIIVSQLFQNKKTFQVKKQPSYQEKLSNCPTVFLQYKHKLFITHQLFRKNREHQIMIFQKDKFETKRKISKICRTNMSLKRKAFISFSMFIKLSLLLRMWNFIGITFRLTAGLFDGMTLKKLSILPCVADCLAFKIFFVPFRILSSL